MLELVALSPPPGLREHQLNRSMIVIRTGDRFICEGHKSRGHLDEEGVVHAWPAVSSWEGRNSRGHLRKFTCWRSQARWGGG